MKDVSNPHKRRVSGQKKSVWVRPATIKTAFQLLRLIDLAIRIFTKLF